MLFLLIHAPAFSQGAVRQPRGAGTTLSFLSRPEAIVAKRNFYILTTAATDPAVVKALNSDSALTKMAAAHDSALQNAAAECTTAVCFTAAMRWSDSDIQAVSNELHGLYQSQPAVRGLANALKSSGFYPLYRKQDGEHLLVTAWTDAASAINRIIDVYGGGTPPRYARSDKARFDTNTPSYVLDLKALTMLIDGEQAKYRIFFFPELKAAVTLLAMNDRLNAAQFEPLQNGLNAAAVARAKTVNWRKYPYSVIVVPGSGPSQTGVRLSALGRIRVEQAVLLYRSGKAPFILVSGGAVHPMLTPFLEAIEMRRELIEAWNIPANAILVDPYARHTTTNIRNAVREIIRYHFATSKPFLVTSDFSQVRGILSSAFDARCQNELHYLPYTSKQKLSATSLAMRPSFDSLQQDAADPMDP
jgi:hypothetical protein